MNDSTLESEYRAARQDVAYFEHPAQTLLRLTGPARASWLHQLVTADVQDLQVGQGARSALLDAKGHFVAVFTLSVRAEEILLIADAAVRQDLYTTLRRYLFRAKAMLADASDEFAVFTVVGPRAPVALEKVFNVAVPTANWQSVASSFETLPALIIKSELFSAPAFDVLVRSAQRASFSARIQMPRLSDAAMETLRVEAGTPRWGADIDESVLALEAPHGLNIRVDQGCYVGQEVVARIVHRGHVNRKFVGLEMDSDRLPRARDRIYDAQDTQKEIGIVTSVATSPALGHLALGYVRREYVEEKQMAVVGENALRAQLVELPFAVTRT